MPVARITGCSFGFGAELIASLHNQPSDDEFEDVMSHTLDIWD